MFWWTIGLMLAITALLTTQTVAFLKLAQENRLFFRAAAQQEVSASVRQYFRETTQYPAGLSALAALPDYRQLRTYLARAQGGLAPSWGRSAVEIAGASGLTDTAWTYSRAVVFALRDDLAAPGDYLTGAMNSCPPASGSSEFATAASWCGSRQGWWKRYESRFEVPHELTKERIRQTRTITKLSAGYNASGSFPDPGTASPVPLYSLAGAGSDPANCSGTFSWAGVPLGCEDLFSRWGSPVQYMFLAPQAMVISATSPFRNNVGQTLVVATEIDLRP